MAATVMNGAETRRARRRSTVARNVLIDAARKRQKNPAPIRLVDEAGDGGIPIDSLEAKTARTDDALVQRETELAVAAALGELPDAQREAYLLKESGLTFEAIAQLTGVKKNTVKSRLRYALEKLRSILIERQLLTAPVVKAEEESP